MSMRSNRRITLPMGLLTVGAWASWAWGHVFVFEWQRAGRADCRDGTGWFVECYWGIPDQDAANLLTAERYILGAEPTFTFEADYIDWPAGPTTSDLDTSFVTMGDFLDGHVTNLSDPEALNLPFAHFMLRATAYLNIQISASRFPDAPPIWMDFGMASFDGGRVRIDDATIFRMVVPDPPDSFFFEDAIVTVSGAFPIEVMFFQRVDPDNVFNMERAGVEFYTCHPDGLDLPGGQLLPCPDDQPARGAPPRIFYEERHVVSPIPGDFDTDGDVDLRDVSFFMNCFTGPENEDRYDDGCFQFDLDLDENIDLDDYVTSFVDFAGPLECHR